MTESDKKQIMESEKKLLRKKSILRWSQKAYFCGLKGAKVFRWISIYSGLTGLALITLCALSLVIDNFIFDFYPDWGKTIPWIMESHQWISPYHQMIVDVLGKRWFMAGLTGLIFISVTLLSILAVSFNALFKVIGGQCKDMESETQHQEQLLDEELRVLKERSVLLEAIKDIPVSSEDPPKKGARRL